MKKLNIKKLIMIIIITLILYEIYSFKNNLNLNLKEINTVYNSTNEDKLLGYVNEEEKKEDPTWLWPTDLSYYLTTRYSNYHPAIDIVPTTSNHNIYSSFAGEVITNSYRYDNGNYLVIKQDNGYYILYAHLSQKLVNVGVHVNKGDLIGIMGQTGFATGIHLHYSIWTGYPYQSSHVEPFNFFDQSYNH